MMKIIYTIFAICVIGGYATASFMGWEFASSGSRSFLGVPFLSGGPRGGK